MISRYASPEMAALWSDEARYARWRDVELAVLRAQTELGLVSPHVLDVVRSAPVPSVERVREIETDVRHDVVAFVLAFTEDMDATSAGFVHRGLTSSDVVDTAQALALRTASDRIVAASRELVVLMGTRALQHRRSICVARTHGQAAAVDVFGHRLADFAFALDRVTRRLESISQALCIVNVTGPVGTGVDLSPVVREAVAKDLGLHVPTVTTQVVFRDSLASWIAEIAVLGGVCEAFATDVRLGHHDGVAELSEGRGSEQVGSSSMPHKNNPIVAEQICGLARLLRGYVGPIMENIALWQHRDLTHSSVERVVLPDVTALAEYTVVTTAKLCAGLVVHERTMLENVARAGRGLASSGVLTGMLASGISRAKAMTASRLWASGGDAHVLFGDGATSNRAPRDVDGVADLPVDLDAEVAVAIQQVLASETLLLLFDDVEELLGRIPRSGRSQSQGSEPQ